MVPEFLWVFWVLGSFSLGLRPVFLLPGAYFRVCVFVAVILLTETSLYSYGPERYPYPPLGAGPGR